jgi:membrane protein
MAQTLEEKMLKTPIVNLIIKALQRIHIPGLSGLSVYELLKMYLVGVFKGALTARAGGIAYSFLIATFPFLIFILTLVKYIPLEGFQDDFIYLLNQWLPPTTSDAVHDQVISYIMNHNYGGLVSLYFLASVLLMSNGISSIFGGFENSYHVEVNRNFFKQYIVSLGVSLLLGLYLLLIVLAAFYFELGIEKLKSNGLVDDGVFWIMTGQKVFFGFMVFISVSTLFYYGTKESKHLSFISAGSVMTTLLILLLAYFFGIYVAKYSRYNELYGSIGTLLVFMLYVWLNSILLLLGFELNASLQRLKKYNSNQLESNLN